MREGLAARLDAASGGRPDLRPSGRSIGARQGGRVSKARVPDKPISPPEEWRVCSILPRKLAKKAGDSFVHRRRVLLQALRARQRKRLLRASSGRKMSAPPQKSQQGHPGIAPGQDSGFRDSPKMPMTRSKKYARDLTELARSGKLDPVIGPRRGNSPHISRFCRGAQRTTPFLNRRAGRGQDGDRRRTRVADCQPVTYPKASATNVLMALDMGSLIRRSEVSRRIRGAAQGRAFGNHGGCRRDRAFSSTSSTRCGRGQGGRRDGRLESFEAGTRAPASCIAWVRPRSTSTESMWRRTRRSHAAFSRSLYRSPPSRIRSLSCGD